MTVVTRTNTTKFELPSEFQEIFAETIKEAVRAEISKNPKEPSPNQKQLFTRQETAEIYKIGLPTLDSYIKAGYIPCFRIGNKIRIKAEDVSNALVKINFGR